MIICLKFSTSDLQLHFMKIMFALRKHKTISRRKGGKLISPLMQPAHQVLEKIGGNIFQKIKVNLSSKLCAGCIKRNTGHCELRVS